VILRVGLTGGIATGKTTISRTFAGLGCVTVDADAVVARLYRPGAAGHEALVRTYGRAILQTDGEIDRRKLADLAFADADASKRLNALIHPLVLEEEERAFEAERSRFPDRERIFIVEATLLLEAGGRARYDRIVVIDTPAELQIERGVGRGMAREEVARRIAHQMPREERLRHADYVIDNSRDARTAEIDTHRVFNRLQADLAQKKLGVLPPPDSSSSIPGR
jgi:dephospho-CoA kinase